MDELSTNNDYSRYMPGYSDSTDKASAPIPKTVNTARIDLEALRQWAKKRWMLDETHGYPHWRRVELNGIKIATANTDEDVVRCFAYLHDCARVSNGPDEEHGPRAAEVALTLRNTLLAALTDEQMDKLLRACREHTTTHRTGDDTIDVCFDADRLDLGRVGITPDPYKMATVNGALAAKELDAEPASASHFQSAAVPVQPEKKSHHTARNIFFALLILLLAVMAFTNPDRKQHEMAIRDVAAEYVDDQISSVTGNGGNFFESLILKGVRIVSGLATDAIVDAYLEENFKVDNYLLFSIGTLTLPNDDEKKVSVGILGKVISYSSDKEESTEK